MQCQGSRKGEVLFSYSVYPEKVKYIILYFLPITVIACKLYGRCKYVGKVKVKFSPLQALEALGKGKN
jgi:hypothetical protein